MKLLSRLSVSSRFLLVLLIGFTFQAGISLVSLLMLKQSMLNDRTTEVKHLLETAYSTVAFYHGQAAKGLMTDAAARDAARNAVRAMRYDNNNYYFIWAMDGTGIAHGSHPEFEGHNLLESPYKDKFPVISYMAARLIETCRSHQAEGVTSYRMMKPGGDKPIGKIAYTKLFAPWGWSIGTGAYVDDIDATFRSQAFSLLWVFTALIALAGIVTSVLGHDLSSAMVRLSARVASVAKGELDGTVPEVHRRDEIGIMARALLVLRDNSKEALELKLDQLTGLPTRKLLMDRLKQAIATSYRSGQFGGLLMIDLDRFKALNDTQGHDVGDLLLKEVANRLTASVREGDTVARLGGDEFVVFVVNIGLDEEEASAAAEIIGEKIRVALSQPFQLAGITHCTSASVGITVFKGNQVSAEELIKQADLAMYKSKENGRNACRFFDPHMEATVRERTAMEEDLRRAIAENQFRLHYQPQIGHDGRLKGAEALIRWFHGQRGLVPPDAFIHLAEETGLIVPLGQWVLENACHQIAAWGQEPEMAKLRVAVNVSAREFEQPGFVDHLLRTLESTGADPKRLELELTESLLVGDVDEIIEKMQTLRARGVCFSLDDFGTGYSSLSYLKRMPLNQVKIDRSFVRDVLVDPNDAVIAKTIVALAHALGLDVIAEGVETVEQLDFLRQAGCNSHQGYYFSRPLPLDLFEKFVHDSSDVQEPCEVVA